MTNYKLIKRHIIDVLLWTMAGLNFVLNEFCLTLERWTHAASASPVGLIEHYVGISLYNEMRNCLSHTRTLNRLHI